MGSWIGDRRILALAMARMTDAVGNSFLIVVLPLYIHSNLITGSRFGLSTALITGVVLSMFGFLNSIGQPFTGRLSDTIGKRKIFVLLGLAILGVTNAAYILASTYWHLLVIRALQGIGVAFTIPATIALVNELADVETRGGNMGLFNTFRLIGFGTGPIVAGAIIEEGPYVIAAMDMSGFQAAFLIAAGTAAISFVLVEWLVSDPAELEANAGSDLSIAVFDKGGDRLLDPVFTLGIASLFMAVGIALLAAIEPIVNDHLNQGSTWFGIEFGAFIFAQVLLQIPVGRASDRYGRRPFILIGMAILAPATLLQGLVTTPYQMVGARFLQGIAGAMVFAPALALAGDLARTGESGTKLSVLTMSFGLGTAIGPLSAGYLVGFAYVAPFAFGAILAVLGGILVFTQIEETAPAVT